MPATNKELIASLKENGVLRSKRIEAALRTVDRADFVPPELHAVAYADEALPIGEGRGILVYPSRGVISKEQKLKDGSFTSEEYTGFAFVPCVSSPLPTEEFQPTKNL